MVEVYPGLFVGNQEDYEVMNSFHNCKEFEKEFSFVGAAKYPWHKEHAKMDGSDCEGYEGKAMPKDQKEYLYAEREHALYCNLIDAKDPAYIPDEIILKCLDFIQKEMQNDRKVLICCNQGESRSPSIAMMYMIEDGFFDDCRSVYNVLDRFGALYPIYNPANGMEQKVIEFWRKYKDGK